MNTAIEDILTRFGPYIRPHRTILLVAFSLSIISTMLGMVQPLFAKYLIDRVLLEKHHELLLPTLALLILVLLGGFLIRIANSYIYTRYSAKMLFKMRQDLFDHLHRVPLSFYSRNKIGDIYSRLGSDIAEIQGFITVTLPGYLFNLLTVLVTAGILIWLDWRMALLCFCSLPLSVLLVRWIKPRLTALAKTIAESNADIAHFLFEALSGTSVIRAFGAEKLESQKLDKKHSSLLQVLMRSQLLRGLSGSIPLTFTIINMAVLYGYGGRLVIQGSLSLGALVAFAFYQGRVFGPVQALIDGFLALQTARVALARVQHIWQVRPDFTNTGRVIVLPETARGDLTFDNVSYAYEANEPVLKNISFTLAAGRVTAIIGPNGVGKTTICHLMTNLVQPDAGCITLDGIDLKTIDTGFLKKQIALVSQDTFLFHTSVLENLRFGRPDATEEQIMAATEAIGIHSFIRELPHGYHTVLGDRGIRLSGGQKQLISIARALLMDPAILILDEPTAFLDPEFEERMKQVFVKLLNGRTIILVSHRLETIRKAEQIVALDHTGLVYSGPPSHFLEQREADWMQDRNLPVGHAVRPDRAVPQASIAVQQREGQ